MIRRDYAVGYSLIMDFQPDDEVFYLYLNGRTKKTHEVPCRIEEVFIKMGGEISYKLKDVPPEFINGKTKGYIPQSHLKRRWN